MTQRSAIYGGHVFHTRLKPTRHRLRYRVFSLLLDLDELPELDRLRLFGSNRAAIFSFLETDHGDGREGGLRAWVEGRLQAAGIAEADVAIRVLCYPRIFGYVFNPLSVFFCYARSGSLLATLYEVGNTFGERHTYVIPVATPDASIVEQSCAKQMYVSPFIPSDCTYKFRVEAPGGRISVRIEEADAGGPLLVAAFAGRRLPLTDASLLRALISYPLMTLKVSGAIHFEALRLWLKGIPVIRHRPAAAVVASTIVARADSGGPAL